MKFVFNPVHRPKNVLAKDWKNWKWQLRHAQIQWPPQQATKSQDIKQDLKYKNIKFPEGTTPYYYRLIKQHPVLSRIVKFSTKENMPGSQSMQDPLGEEQHSLNPRLIHRYPDRVLFLVTDHCGVYCRYCTRKRFTGQRQSVISKQDQDKSLNYIQDHPGIREVILSGGDPLCLSDSILKNLLQKIRSIEHVEIIRIASRMPVVCPFRLSPELIRIFKAHQPLFLMTHFNHPLELSKEVQKAVTRVANAGILMFNQSVLLNQINNHPSIIQALMRRLLYLRIKPYYMFQCDPSEGSDHFRTTIENSKWIQKDLWGVLSGLALPNLSLDIPHGGGKVGLVPDFFIQKDKKSWQFKGWDFVQNTYVDPSSNQDIDLKHIQEYQQEYDLLKNQTYKK